MVKNLPANAGAPETQVGSLVWEDPLKEGMISRFSILVWRIPWTEEPGGLQSIGSHGVRCDLTGMHIILMIHNLLTNML